MFDLQEYNRRLEIYKNMYEAKSVVSAELSKALSKKYPNHNYEVAITVQNHPVAYFIKKGKKIVATVEEAIADGSLIINKKGSLVPFFEELVYFNFGEDPDIDDDEELHDMNVLDIKNHKKYKKHYQKFYLAVS